MPISAIERAPAGSQSQVKDRMKFVADDKVVSPVDLGMGKAIDLIGASNETFFYRAKRKRIIDYRVISENRWKSVAGPLVYAVTDWRGVIRYVGKLESESALQSRWLRHQTIHHQERARNLYIGELDAGRGPLTVWTVSANELRKKLPKSIHIWSEKEIVVGLEALWINRWRSQLSWNKRPEPLLAGFDDGRYWR